MNGNVQKKVVLIVDDDDGVRELVAEILLHEGHSTLHARNGEEALKIIAEKGNDIDLIISDVEMPGEFNGPELLDRVKMFYPLKPIVVFMSGYDVDLDDLYARGVCSFIKKPFSFESFEKAINEGLSKLPTYTREYDRLDVEMDIKLSLDSLEEARSFSVLNIGQGGIFVRTTAAVEIGHKVEFEISFTGEEISHLKGVGEVAWVRKKDTVDAPAGIGIKFLSLSENERKFIHAFVVKKKITAFIPKK